jgi:nitrite reductase/ring-hydroxylating ferredoxin subunit
MGEFIQVAESARVRERFGYAVTCEGQSIVLFRHKGKVYALNNRCPHQAAPISDGYVENGYAVCPHHGWKFKLSDGSFIGNELLRVPTYAVKEEDGFIYIQISSSCESPKREHHI